MSNEKTKIEINTKTFEKIEKIFNQSKGVYTELKLASVEDFITYILENFSNSSVQFEKLNDQMKNLMENVNLENLNFEDLFKNIVKSTQNKDKAVSEKKETEAAKSDGVDKTKS
ncbi:MAG: hypothetical protein HUJ42_01200 [Malacoplasma sp.]|nr:hypothetical protein [Malacoplasma sp.]